MKLPSIRIDAGASSVIAIVCALAPSQIKAARISEPSTVFYGRIVERVGNREFPMTAGRLVWNLRTTGLVEQTYQLTTPVQSFAEGRFAYRLSIPHEVLAYDLTVNPKAIGLAGTGGGLRHGLVTLDGQPLTLVPTAVAGLAIDQTRRGGAVRIDLVLAAHSPDGDADGAPDWWEDQNGLDKYDPTDAAQITQEQLPSPEPTRGIGSSEAQTFAGWRSLWFPGVSSDLDTFGQEDPDHDGIPNLLEYAFDLNPTESEMTTSPALPHAFTNGTRSGIAFRPRLGATDLTYIVETSPDLLRWNTGFDLVYESSRTGANGPETKISGDALESHRFYRVRVNRN